MAIHLPIHGPPDACLTAYLTGVYTAITDITSRFRDVTLYDSSRELLQARNVYIWIVLYLVILYWVQSTVDLTPIFSSTPSLFFIVVRVTEGDLPNIDTV